MIKLLFMLSLVANSSQMTHECYSPFGSAKILSGMEPDDSRKWWTISKNHIDDDYAVARELIVNKVSSNPLQYEMNLQGLNNYLFSICSSIWSDPNKIKSYKLNPKYKQANGETPLYSDPISGPVLILKPKKDPVSSRFRIAAGENRVPLMLVEKVGASERIIFDYKDIYNFQTGEIDLDIKWAGDINGDGRADFTFSRHGQVNLFVSSITDGESSYTKYGAGGGYVYEDNYPLSELKNILVFFGERYRLKLQDGIYKDKDEWWGIFRSKDKLDVKKVRLKEETVQVPENRIDGPGFNDNPDAVYVNERIIRWDLPEKDLESALFFIKKVDPSINPKSSYAFANDNSSKVTIPYSDGSVALALKPRKDVSRFSRSSKKEEILVATYQGMDVLLLDYDELLNDENGGIYVSLLFAGDINADSLPDFVIHFGPTYRSQKSVFFLSQKRARGFDYLRSNVINYPWESCLNQKLKSKFYASCKSGKVRSSF